MTWEQGERLVDWSVRLGVTGKIFVVLVGILMVGGVILGYQFLKFGHEALRLLFSWSKGFLDILRREVLWPTKHLSIRIERLIIIYNFLGILACFLTWMVGHHLGINGIGLIEPLTLSFGVAFFVVCVVSVGYATYLML